MTAFRLAVSLALSIAVVPAGLALAGGSGDVLVQATLMDDVPDGDLADEIVSCPGGQRVVGGGAGGEASAGEDDQDTAYSGPLGETTSTHGTKDGDVGRHWLVGQVNQSGATADYKAFALCSEASDAKVEAKSFSLNSGKTGGAKATCPSGRRALGGGIGTTGPVDDFNHFVQLSGPLDGTGKTAKTGDGDIAKSWFASVTNATDEPVGFKVFALCSNESNAKLEATKVTNVPDDGYGEGRADCPGAKRATGGGIGTTGPVGSQNAYDMSASGPLGPSGTSLGTNDGDRPLSWLAAVDNDQGATQDFKVFAICE